MAGLQSAAPAAAFAVKDVTIWETGQHAAHAIRNEAVLQRRLTVAYLSGPCKILEIYLSLQESRLFAASPVSPFDWRLCKPSLFHGAQRITFSPAKGKCPPSEVEQEVLGLAPQDLWSYWRGAHACRSANFVSVDGPPALFAIHLFCLKHWCASAGAFAEGSP